MTENNKIFGFCGRKRSGKTTLANVLKENYDAEIVTIANYLKQLCCDILGYDIETLNKVKDDGAKFSYYPDKTWYEKISEKTGIEISDIIEDIGKIEFTNVRQMLQVIGTDCIRKHKPNWHVECMKKDIEELLSKGKIVAIDDVRFPNEKNAIEELGGTCYFIIRPINNNISNHVSETSLTWQDFTYSHIIINDFSHLKEYVNKFISHYKCNMTPMYCSDFIFKERFENILCGYEDINLKFGIENNDLIKFIIDQNSHKEQFLKRGILSIEFNDSNTYKTFLSNYYDKSCHNRIDWDAPLHNIVIYNPIINENLKIHL